MNKNALVNIIKSGIFLLLFTPLIKSLDYYFPFVGPKSLYFMGVVEFIFFLWIILAWHFREYRPNWKNPVTISFLVLLAILFISAVFGVNFHNSFWSTYERMGGVLMFFHIFALIFVSSLVFTRQDWMRFFGASAAVSVLIALIAMFDTDTIMRSGGTIGNDSFWGTYILFNIFISLYLFLSYKWSENREIKFLTAAAFVLLLTCLILQGSQLWLGIATGHFEMPRAGIINDLINGGARAAKIAFFAGLVLLGIIKLLASQKKKTRNFALVLLASIIIAGSVIASFAARPGNPIYDFAVAKLDVTSIQGRTVVWEIAWKGFMERPYLGWGPENFDVVFARHYNPCIGMPECTNNVWYDRVHNIILDNLVTTGIVGLVAYLAVFAATFYVLWRACRAGTLDSITASIFTALLVAYLLQNLTVFDMVTSYFMWAVCLGYIASFYRPQQLDGKDKPMNLQILPTIIILMLAIGCMMYFIIKPHWVDRNIAVASTMPFNVDQRLGTTRRVLEGSQIGKFQARILFATQLQEVIQEPKMIANIKSELIYNQFEFLSGELEKSRAQAPLDYRSRLELGKLYNAWSLMDRSKLEKAREVLLEAIDLSPTNQHGYLVLAQTKLFEGDYDAGLELLRKARDLYPANIKIQDTYEQIIKLKESQENDAPKKEPSKSPAGQSSKK